jgi:hypothetical protein
MRDHIVFVHGWSIYNTGTYGALPERLAEAIPGVKVTHLRLAKYISFRDEVRMNDVARAMEAAVWKELNPAGGAKFAAITHSTGGPVVRTWWHQYYLRRKRPCPMTHAVHLAAAHFGSALAQLGKGTLGRIKSFTESIEPGEGILDWLELGSAESLVLNTRWAAAGPVTAGPDPVFHFCLSGQQIDRKFYDQLNSYTGEMGSDGTVRVAAANLNATHVRLRQKPPTASQIDSKRPSLLEFDSPGIVRSQEVPFTLVPGVSHVGETMGIMRSVKKSGPGPAVVERIKEALAVTDAAGYARLARRFQQENAAVHDAEAVEVEDRIFHDRFFLHDPCGMVIVRVRDDEGAVPQNLRITFLGPNDDPNALPEGFLIDRQKNQRNPGVITFFFNCAILFGDSARFATLSNGKRKKVRAALPGLAAFGLRVDAAPEEGFAHYHPALARATPDLLKEILRPDETTVLDITLRRIVREGAFSLTADLKPADFRKDPPGPAVAM